MCTWTLNEEYTYHTTDGWDLFLEYCPIYVAKGIQPPGSSVDILMKVWKKQDPVNRHDANPTSFLLYCFNAYVGKARQRLSGSGKLQKQVNEHRKSKNLNNIY
jgi:hypothetical protein